MYIQIENEFKIGSKERANSIIFILVTVIIAIITTLPFAKTDAPIWLFLVVGLAEGVFLYVGSYIYMFATVKKDKKVINDEKDKVDFFNIDSVVDLYKKIVHRRDLDLLFNITKKYHIDTTEKLQEAIRHYQNLLPRKVVSGGTWMSIFALGVSIAAFITVKSQTSITAHLEVLVAVWITLGLLYLAFKVIGQELLQRFGKHAMYERLEAALSELYFTATTDSDDDKENVPERKENE